MMDPNAQVNILPAGYNTLNPTVSVQKIGLKLLIGFLLRGSLFIDCFILETVWNFYNSLFTACLNACATFKAECLVFYKQTSSIRKVKMKLLAAMELHKES